MIDGWWPSPEEAWREGKVSIVDTMLQQQSRSKDTQLCEGGNTAGRVEREEAT